MALQVNILFFASMTDKTGIERWIPSLPDGTTLEDIKNIILDEFPDSADLMPVCYVAVNQEYVLGNPVLTDSDEIAFFPPVSGG
jgi:molybdopterin converting factor subunit 1